jgi:hypothetical protein
MIFLISNKAYHNYFRLFIAAYIIGFTDTLLDGELKDFYSIFHSIGYGLGIFILVLFLFGFAQLLNRIVFGRWFKNKYEKMWLVMLVMGGFWLLARIISIFLPEYSNQI